jgi:hypothetical protein
MEEIKITKEMSIGDVMEKHPSTEKVFVKYFGNGCFTCPGTERGRKRKRERLGAIENGEKGARRGDE